MIKRDHLISLLLVVLLVGLFASIVFAQEELPNPNVISGRPLKIAWVSMSTTPESVQRIYTQAKIETAYRGWDWSESTGNDTSVTQREAFSTMLDTKPDAIVIVYMSLPSFNDLILEARKQGIGVYSIDSGIMDGIIADSTQPNAVAGTTVLYWGLEYLGRKGSIAFTKCPEPQSWMTRERIIPARALISEEFTYMENLGTYEYTIASYTDQAFTIGTTLADKYGDKLDWVFSDCDPIGAPVANGLMTGGLTRDQVIVTGIDGGKEAFNLIRTGTPFIATYAQPFEKYCHNIFEVIDEIQIKGVLPGDKESSLSAYGQIIYENGAMVTPKNVPEEGTSVYQVFDFWGASPDDPEAWVNWYKKVNIEPYKF